MSTAFAPGSPEWARLVTASKVAGILGISPWDSQYKVWCVMAGLIPPDPENEAMRRGNMLEDAILNWWLADHPAAIELGRQVTCQIPDEPWAATCDSRKAGVSGGNVPQPAIETCLPSRVVAGALQPGVQRFVTRKIQLVSTGKSGCPN